MTTLVVATIIDVKHSAARIFHIRIVCKNKEEKVPGMNEDITDDAKTEVSRDGYCR